MLFKARLFKRHLPRATRLPWVFKRHPPWRSWPKMCRKGPRKVGMFNTRRWVGEFRRARTKETHIFCDPLAATPFGLYNNKSGRGRAPAPEAHSIVSQVQPQTVVDTAVFPHSLRARLLMYCSWAFLRACRASLNNTPQGFRT